MTAIVITSTGTEIGKTYITAGLIRHLRTSGRTVEAIKPVVTGFDAATMAESDPGVLLAALERPVTLDEIAKISPWRYAAPLSPDIAAREEGTPLDFTALGEFSLRSVLTRRDVLLIEGIGGVMVPLDDRHTVLDWMLLLRLPLILVTGSYLGTISHTLTALDTLLRRGLAVLTVVVNETEGSNVALADTAATIGRFVHPINVLTVPRSRTATDNMSAFAQVFADAARAGNNSDRDQRQAQRS